MDYKILLAGVTAVAVIGAGVFFMSGSKETAFEASGGGVSSSGTTAEGGTTTEGSGNQQTAHSAEGLRNVMYYSDWSIWDGQGNYYPQDLPTQYYTHLNLAFLDFDGAGYLSFTDKDAVMEAGLDLATWGEENAGILAVLRGERAENPNVKLGVSIGGWSKSGDFSMMASHEETRKTFATQLALFLTYTGFDYVDIDWEYPAVVRQPDYTDNQRDEGTPSSTAADKENYVKLLEEIRRTLDEYGERNGKYYELSVALPMDQEKLALGVDIPRIFSLVDFANIMTYDARGAFDDVTGHHSPLYGNPSDPFYDKGYSIDQTVEYLLAQGADSQKIVIGAAFYSRGWESVASTEVVSGLPALFAEASAVSQNADQSPSMGAQNDLAITMGDGGIAGGVWAYRNFDLMQTSYPNLVEYWDDVAKAPYLYNGSAFFTYDNPESLGEKANYVHEKNLGGIISWQASNDAVTDTAKQRDALTKAIYEGLYQGEALPDHEIIYGFTPATLSMTTGEGLVTLLLENKSWLQETSAVLREVETQAYTICYPKLYLNTGGVALVSTGNQTVTLEGDYVVVDLATAYETRFLSIGQQSSITLKTADGGAMPVISSVELAQRQGAEGAEVSRVPLLGEGALSAPDTGVVTTPSTGNSGETATTPSIPVGSLENPVEFSADAATAGHYATGAIVSMNGKIYQAQEQVWWGSPMENPTAWTEVGAVEGYVAPEPQHWSREAEATGAYTVGARVLHNGKVYVQVGTDTAWWCEPGSDPLVWAEE